MVKSLILAFLVIYSGQSRASIIFQDDFETDIRTTEGGNWSYGSNTANMTDPTYGIYWDCTEAAEGSCSLRATIPKWDTANCQSGCPSPSCGGACASAAGIAIGLSHANTPNENWNMTDGYIGLCIKFSDPFTWSSTATKQIRLNDNLEQEWTIWESQFNNGVPRIILDERGDSTGFGGTSDDYSEIAIPANAYQPGTWHKIILHIEQGTAATGDGSIEGWMDGTKIFDFLNDVGIAATGETNEVDRIWMQKFFNDWGGTNMPAQDQYFWFDDMVVATTFAEVDDNVSCAGGGASSLTWPNVTQGSPSWSGVTQGSPSW